jgi:hypothetical protein
MGYARKASLAETLDIHEMSSWIAQKHKSGLPDGNRWISNRVGTRSDETLRGLMPNTFAMAPNYVKNYIRRHKLKARE